MFVFLYPSALQQNTDLFPFSSFNSILLSFYGRKENKIFFNQDLFETLKELNSLNSELFNLIVGSEEPDNLNPIPIGPFLSNIDCGCFPPPISEKF